VPGSSIVRASWIGTVTFAAALVVGTVDLDLVGVTVVVSLVLFALGTAAFLTGYARAIARSRYEAIGMGGLFFLAGSAPRGVQVQLLTSLGVQVAAGLVAATIRIYTPVAFGLLVPMYGLGLAGLWGATYGQFAPREPPSPVE
jgi:hypothetical protein